MPDWDVVVYDPARPRPAPVEGAPAFSRLPLLAVEHGAPRPDVGRPIAVRAPYDVAYVRLLQGIDFCLEQRVDILNLSLGPPADLPSTGDDPDPLYAATDVARQLGVPVVVAAGNGGPKPGSLQFLAKAPWVIAVGATDDEGRLLDSSARGTVGGRTPDLVSSGVLRAPDPRFPTPSTSFAAPKVAAVAGWIKVLLMLIGHDVQALIAGHAPPSQVPVPVIGFCDTGITADALDRQWENATIAEVPRTARQGIWYRTVLEALEQAGIPVSVRNDAATVGLALGLIASPVAGRQPFEVGRGLVSQRQLLHLIQGFVPSRFTQLFGDARALAADPVRDLEVLAELDRKLGSLWDADQCQALAEHIGRGCVSVMARVL
jgi:hypothetical protein